ncbi:MAG: hypothetical protein JO337_07570 [Acidimicrobiales bacterium]|nr:hypothetical protein [Acidimicrobiales bacterium]
MPSPSATMMQVKVPSRIQPLAVVRPIPSSAATRRVSHSGSSTLSGSTIQPAAPSVASTWAARSK